MKLSHHEVGRWLKELAGDMPLMGQRFAGFVTVTGARLFPVHYAAADGQLSDTALLLLRRSLKLTTPEFRQWVEGTMSRDAYFELLRNKGVAQR
jgi:hypothetical protein